MEDLKILVDIKQVYGNELIYPADEAAKIFCKIAGTKTLTREAIKAIRQLGYKVEIKTKALE